MPRVVLVGNLAQLTGGVAEFQLSATSVKQLFRQLSELHPALEPHLAEGVAVAIDGQIYQDALFQPIGPDSEVFLLPQIAGGGARFLFWTQIDGELRIHPCFASSSSSARQSFATSGCAGFGCSGSWGSLS